MEVEDAANIIYNEWQKAKQFNDDFKTNHDGFGVITEEYFELVEAIRSDDLEQIKQEVSHLGAMTLRFLTDRI